jgi:shikimate kinase
MNLVLVGFMGAGKSEVGKHLAAKRQRQFVDTDELIESRTGLSISKIFEEKGEPYFRKLEREVVSEVAAKDQLVISCGGGAIFHYDNLNKLKKNGVIVYLRAPLEVLIERLKDTSDRPLLKSPQPHLEVKKLFEARRDGYEKAADLVVDTAELSPEEVADLILDYLGDQVG